MSKITKSNCQSIPPMPTNSVPQCHIHMVLEHLQGRWIHHLPGQPVPVPHHSFKEVVFLISNLNISWHNLKPLPLILKNNVWGKRGEKKYVIQEFQTRKRNISNYQHTGRVTFHQKFLSNTLVLWWWKCRWVMTVLKNSVLYLRICYPIKYCCGFFVSIAVSMEINRRHYFWSSLCICSPRQFLFTQCGPGKPKDWVPIVYGWQDGETGAGLQGYQLCWTLSTELLVWCSCCFFMNHPISIIVIILLTSVISEVN